VSSNVVCPVATRSLTVHEARDTRARMHWYRGKKVLVTGGSSGIGRSAARLLVEAGAHVAIAARNQERLDETLGELERLAADGQRVTAFSFDVRDQARIAELKDAILSALGGLDVLIVNQGYAVTGYAHEMDDQAFHDMMDTNFFGHVHVTRAFLPHFLEQRSGHICLVSSMLGFLGCIGYTAYAASKHAVAGYGRCLRNELSPHGIGVSICYPPTTDTPGLAKENEDKLAETWALEEGSQAMPADDVARDMLHSIRKGRFETVPGLANRAIWLAQRFIPSVVDGFLDHDLRSFLKK
jgi:3-dehydrosphinganine reductase